MNEFGFDNMDALLPLRDVVFKTLRQAILTGELKPGERLMEIKLANKLGVSRTPIREAIRQLELDGLVIMVPRKGAQVAHITEKSMSDVMEVRLALDELTASLACARISDEDKEMLVKACHDFEDAVGSADLRKIASADVEFHDIILKAANNLRLSQIVNNLAEQMYRYRVEYLKDSSYHTKLAEEHEALTDAISRGDVDMAREVTRKHIYDQEKIVIANAVKSSDT